MDFTRRALGALQVNSEAYLVELFQQAQLQAIAQGYESRPCQALTSCLSCQVTHSKEASNAQRPRQYSLQEVPMSSVRSLTTGSVLMLAVRFEEVVSRGAGAAVALFSGAVIREMYRTKILSVKV